MAWTVAEGRCLVPKQAREQRRVHQRHLHTDLLKGAKPKKYEKTPQTTRKILKSGYENNAYPGSGGCLKNPDDEDLKNRVKEPKFDSRSPCGAGGKRSGARRVRGAVPAPRPAGSRRFPQVPAGLSPWSPSAAPVRPAAGCGDARSNGAL